MHSLPDGLRETIPTGFRERFLASGLREAGVTEALEIEHQPTFHCSSLLLRHCSKTRAKQHGHERRQHLHRGFRGGFRESPCYSRTPHPLLAPPPPPPAPLFISPTVMHTLVHAER